MSDKQIDGLTHKNLAKRTFLLRQKLIESLQDQTLTDPLTGVGNIRAQEKFLILDEKRQKTNFQREKRSTGSLYPTFGLIMYLDADGLKEANYKSREKGDELLQNIAKAAEMTAQRANDLVFRQGGGGGDEFAIFLPGDTDEQMEGIVAKFEERLKKESELSPVSASIAIGKYGFGVSARETLKKLDTALSEAKKKREIRGTHVDTVYLK